VPADGDGEPGVRIQAANSRLRTDLRVIERIARAILLLLVLGVFWIAKDILVPLVVALLLSLLLSPLVSLVERLLWLPRAIGSLLVILALVGALFLGVAQLAGPAQKWIATAPEKMKVMEERVRSIREPLRQAQEAGRQIDELTKSSSDEPESVVMAARPGMLSSVLSGTPQVLGTAAAVLLLLYFFLSSGNRFLRRMVEVAPRLADKRVVVSIAREVQQEMSRYLLMVSSINLGLGAATAIALALMGVPNPLLWGAVACLLNFVPYVGPLCTILLLTLAGFSAFDTLGGALAVPGVFFVLTAIEGQMLTPTILGRRLSLDPTAVFVWLMLWGWMWGIVGILVAGPLLACFRIVCQHVESLHSVGILISDGSSSAAPSRDPLPAAPEA
jgi:predicted PurR-regulated permease PerM